MNFPWNVSLYGHYLKELSMMCNLIFNHHLTSLKLEDSIEAYTMENLECCCKKKIN